MEGVGTVPTATGGSWGGTGSRPITGTLLKTLFPTHADAAASLDLSRELSCEEYGLLHVVLRNALQELVSSRTPRPLAEEQVDRGLLFLYDLKCENYLEDGVEWKQSKMAVKLVVQCEETGQFRLKNRRGQPGVPVMRRQTWQGAPSSEGWRRHEYRLVLREQFFNPTPDGGMRECKQLILQPHPCLVHYFRKRGTTGPVPALVPAVPAAQHAALAADGAPPKQRARRNNKRPPPSSAAAASSAPASAVVSGGDEDMMPEVVPFALASMPPASATPIALPPVQETAATVQAYAPMRGHCSERTRVIAVVEAFSGSPGGVSCVFEGVNVPAEELRPGVFSFETPSRPMPGIVFWWLVTRGAVAGDSVRCTTPAPFYLLPSTDRGFLSLVSSNLGASGAAVQMMQQFRHCAQELDLSQNGLVDVDFLEGFYNLSTLILDSNRIHSDSRLPAQLPRVRVLTVNRNQICNLERWVCNLAACCPALQYLSMLDNVACPFPHGQQHHYYNYRIYVISRLPHLTQLDSTVVTAEERRHASCLATEADPIKEEEEEEDEVRETNAPPQQHPDDAIAPAATGPDGSSAGIAGIITCEEHDHDPSQQDADPPPMSPLSESLLSTLGSPLSFLMDPDFVSRRKR